LRGFYLNLEQSEILKLRQPNDVVLVLEESGEREVI